MKKILLISFLVASYPVFGQATYQPHIFNDTSLYFIQPTTNDNPIELSTDELILAEQLLLQAIEEFNLAQQRYADSVNPKRKKRKEQGFKLSADSYNFRLTPVMMGHEKVIGIAGNCKTRLHSKKKNALVYYKDWRQKFIDPDLVDDGGACFIRVTINLTLKAHGRLVINGEG